MPKSKCPIHNEFVYQACVNKAPISMLTTSFLLPFSADLTKTSHNPQGCEPPRKSCKSDMCLQGPIGAKIQAVITKGKDQVVKIKRKLYLITSPQFFHSVLLNPSVRFSFIIPTLLLCLQHLLLLF